MKKGDIRDIHLFTLAEKAKGGCQMSPFWSHERWQRTKNPKEDVRIHGGDGVPAKPGMKLASH